MTEETNAQAQPTQPVQQTQEAQPVQEEMTTIYASTNAVPFAAMLIPKKWADIGNTYPMTTIQPDPSLKYPKMDWNTMKWFENDTAQAGIDMEDLKQKVVALDSQNQESNAKIDQLLQLSVQTNKALGQLLIDNSKSSATTSTTTSATTPTDNDGKSSATTSADVKGGTQ